MEILDNVDSSLITLLESEYERKKAEKAAKEKAIADENYKIFGYRNPSQFMLEHRQDYIDGTMSGYKYNDYSYYGSYNNNSLDSCNIYFYEWSDIEGNQKRFFKKSEFYKFCEECGITVTDADKRKLQNMSSSYISCKKGKKELVIAYTSYSLGTALKTFAEAYDAENKN